MIWCVLDSDERQHANHNVEHGAAACPHTDSNCNHNVELVFTNSLFLDGNKNHNVEHLAQEKITQPPTMVCNYVLPRKVVRARVQGCCAKPDVAIKNWLIICSADFWMTEHCSKRQVLQVSSLQICQSDIMDAALRGAQVQIQCAREGAREGL